MLVILLALEMVGTQRGFGGPTFLGGFFGCRGVLGVLFRGGLMQKSSP